MTGADEPGGEGPLKFERTRDGDLHRAIKADGFKLPPGHAERSVWRVIVSAATPFAYIAAAVIAVRWFPSSFVSWLLAFALFVAAQRAFLTLVHDSSHKFFSRKRELNDILADYIAAGFIGMLLRKYRKIHLAHHAANGSADDPEHFGYEAVTRVGGWGTFILRYALGLEIPYLLRKYHVAQDEYLGRGRIRDESVDKPRRFEKLSIFVTQGLLAGTFWACGVLPLYPLWLYVAVTWSPLLSRLRFLAEHPGRGELTMSTRGTWWELIYFAPFHFNFHFEHHLWPSIPPYRLKGVHAALVDSGFFARNPQFLAESFVKTLSEYGRRWH